MKKSKNPNRRGFIFIYAYLLIVLFMVYELALLTYFAQNINAFERFSNNTIAYQLAEAGLDSAMAKLKNNEIVFDANGNYTETRNFTLGNYNVTVSNQQEDLDGDGALDGPLAPNTFRITTLASAPAVSNPARPIQQATNVVAYVMKEEKPPFEFAMFGTRSFAMPAGTTFDSYDSRNGSYNDPLNRSAHGDIGTDSTRAGAITLHGSDGGGIYYPSRVFGDAVVGPGGNPGTVIRMGGDSEIVSPGTARAATSPKNYQPRTTNIPSSGPLRVLRGTDYVLPAGVHHFDSIAVQNGATLTSAGPAEIYVDGKVAITPSSFAVIGNEKPSNFLLYAASDGEVDIACRFFSGGIYAPNSRVWIAGERFEFFGAVVGRSIGGPNGDGVGNPLRSRNFHFDEALKEIGSGSAKMNLVSWRTVPIESNSTESE